MPGTTKVLAFAMAVATWNGNGLMGQHPLDSKRMMEFKERIGFDTLAAKEMPGKGVVAEWPNCLELFGLTESDWSGDWSTDESLSMLVAERVTERECVPKRPGERLGLIRFDGHPRCEGEVHYGEAKEAAVHQGVQG
jgi:hypothetical protein